MRRETRRGFALALALLALVCLAALLTGLAFIAREDHLLASTRRHAHRSLTAAEGAAWSVAAQLDSVHLAVPRGAETAVPVPALFADSASGTLLRLGTSTFLLSGSAAVGSGDHHTWKRVGLLVDARLDSAGALLVRPLPRRFWMELP